MGIQLPLVRRSTLDTEVDFWESENAALRGECRRWKRQARQWHEDYQDERDRNWDMTDRYIGWLPAWLLLPAYIVGGVFGYFIGASQ